MSYNTCALSVMPRSPQQVAWRHMEEEHTLEINPVSVFNVMLLSPAHMTSRYINGNILGTCLISVRNVMLHLLGQVISRGMKEHTLERNPISALSVMLPSTTQMPARYMK